MVAIFRAAAFIAFALSAVLAEPLSSSGSIYARQVSGFDPSSIPASCLQTKCQAFVDTVTKQGCSTLECLCTSTVATSLNDCIKCGVDANVAGFNQTVADASIKSYTDACKTAGHPVAIGGGGSSTGTASPSSSSSPASGGGKSGALAMTVNIVGMVAAAALGSFALV